jgi:hypothetical protein
MWLDFQQKELHFRLRSWQVNAVAELQRTTILFIPLSAPSLDRSAGNRVTNLQIRTRVGQRLVTEVLLYLGDVRHSLAVHCNAVLQTMMVQECGPRGGFLAVFADSQIDSLTDNREQPLLWCHAAHPFLHSSLLIPYRVRMRYKGLLGLE